MQELKIFESLKPAAVTMPLNSVKIDFAKSDKDANIVSINGLNAVLTDSARKDVIKISGLDEGSLATIARTTGKDAGVQILQRALKAAGANKVTFAFDGPRITRVVAPSGKALALGTKTVTNLVERAQDKGMILRGLDISPDGTQASIKLMIPGAHDHPTKKGEEVSIGRTIKWDALGGTSLADYVERLVCSNGLVSAQEGRELHAIRPDMDPAQLYQILFADGAERRLATYFEKVSKLQETLMSVREWNEFRKILGQYDKDEQVIIDHTGFGLTTPSWMNEYSRKGFNLFEMTEAQLRNCPTPVNWWDAMNSVTWLASHETKSNVSNWDKAKLQQNAGRMMKKSQLDADGWMTGLPTWN